MVNGFLAEIYGDFQSFLALHKSICFFNFNRTLGRAVPCYLPRVDSKPRIVDKIIKEIKMTTHEKILLIKEQFEDILSCITNDFEFNLDYSEDDSKVCEFSATINGISYNYTLIYWNLQTQTEDAFLHSIKAYLFDVLDGVVNL